MSRSTIPSSPSAAQNTSTARDFITDLGNMLKAFIGINFISIAYAFSKAGIVRGLIGLAVIVLLTEHCCMLLIEIKDSMHVPLPAAVADEDPFSVLDDEEDNVSTENDHLRPGDPNGDPADSPDGDTVSSRRAASQHTQNDMQQRARAAQANLSFGDIARHVGGPHAQAIIEGAILLTQFGFCVGYLIFLSQTVHDLVKSAGSVSPFVLLPLPILAYVAMLRSIRSLGPFSLLANFALLVGFVAVVTFIGKHFNWTPPAVPLTSFPLFFGQVTAAIEGIGLIIPVQTSMKNPEKFPLIFRLALGTITAILATVGVLGFATFGAETHSIILVNFGASPVVVCVKIVLVVGILFTYPLQIVPVFDFAERVFAPEEYAARTAPPPRAPASAKKPGLEAATGEPGADVEPTASAVDGDTDASLSPPLSPRADADDGVYIRSKRVIALRLLVIALTAVTAVVGGASFGIFNALVGSLGATVLAYTGPGMLHYVAFQDRLSPAAKAKDIALVVFGITGGMVGTAASVYEIIQIHTGAATPS